MKYGVLAAIIAALIGGVLYFYSTPETPAAPTENKIEKPAPNQGIGIIDIEKVHAAHPDGEQLNQLLATELRLRLELHEAMRLTELPKPKPPETNTEVFDEATWQKNAQIVISQLAELETKKKVAAEEYRKNSEPRYIEERNKIRDQFANEQLNIQLKLQNADNLRLKQEEINELSKRLEEIEFERNKLQFDLVQKWAAEIEQYADNSIAEERTRLRAEAERLQKAVEEQTRQKESEVAQRNKTLMENSLQEMEDRQVRRREILTDLQKVSRDRAELEKKILDSIADKAAMLAAVNHLEMVLVKHESAPSDKVLRRGVKWNFDFKEPAHTGATIIPGKKSINLTDDLIKEMKRL